ncbi:MAG: alpha/beta hydrolase [Atopobiaceae bacterium]|nr:alpha/beta hydrolase [Atopobiaceae bacterium]
MNSEMIQTSRINMAVRRAGTAGAPKLMLVHGNLSSSVFYEDLMELLADDFDMVAPDLRSFGDTQALPIDATRGLRDHSDDLYALAQTLGWESFGLLGWSMGGGAVMQFAIDHPEMLTGLILEAPLAPFGFAGTTDERGTILEPVGIGCGGGSVNPMVVEALNNKERELFKTVLKNSYVKPPFTFDSETEDKLVDGILKTKTGEGFYPGNAIPCEQWPGFKAGDAGVCNTLSPEYCDLSAIAEMPTNIPVLWIRGDSDVVVADGSNADLATLGQLGIVPGYPGADVYPAQPMLAQTRYVLEQFAARGGNYREVVYENSGHGSHLEFPERFADDLRNLLLT